jgi:hypothetical protein
MPHDKEMADFLYWEVCGAAATHHADFLFQIDPVVLQTICGPL